MFTITKQFSLSKTERLKSRKLIGHLFSKGRVLSVTPLRVVYTTANPANCLQAGFSVGTRNFRRAVDRNRIKRLMREAYRLNKQLLEKKTLAVFFIYIGKKLPEPNVLNEVMSQALLLLKQRTDEPAS